MPDTKRTASGVLGGFAGLVGLSAIAGVLITATVTPAIAVTGAAATGAISMFENMPSVLNIEQLMLPSVAYAKNPDTGEDVPFAQWFEQNRSPVTFDEVAPIMYDSILSSEDPRYYQHGGVDLIGTARAIISNAQGGATQGGSSISQQYVKNVLVQQCEADADSDDARTKCFDEATNSNGTDGYKRKLQEMRYAIQLEKKYSKNDILLGYLNIANFGGTNYGIDAASRYYFNVPAKDLSLAQAAALAGVVQNPNTYRLDRSVTDKDGVAINGPADGVFASFDTLNALVKSGEITQEQADAASDAYPLTKGRQLYVLGRLLEDTKITRAQYVEAAAAPIAPTITEPQTGCKAAVGAEYFCQFVRNIISSDPAFGDTPTDRMKLLQRGGLKIYTSLDWRIQNATNAAMAANAPTSVEGWVDSATGKFGAASISIETDTGRVLAIGQNTIFSESSAYDADPNYSGLVFAGDQKYGRSNGFEAGSTFKLFTLVDWLEKGHSVNEVLNGRYRVIKGIADHCDGDWKLEPGNPMPKNFGGVGGYVGTPMQFTRDSLNTGFFAMAEKLDLCDIKNVATKMGATKGDGKPVKMDGAFSIIGSNNVAPMAIAGAYGTIANNGTYCQPRAIDRVVDANGVELKLPDTKCTPVVDPKVAATAAYALKGVMNGGTGGAANAYDGTPVLGKTGTHEQWQTWMVQSSSKVATAVWVGNSTGRGTLASRGLNNIRFPISKAIQHAANEIYPGSAFPDPDTELTRQVTYDLPNVIGMPLAQAQKTLEDAGFDVTVGAPIDSTEGAGIVAAQDPPAGKVTGGTPITISPSNGQGIVVPQVSGTVENAEATLRAAGFGLLDRQCTPNKPPAPGATAVPEPDDGTVTGTNPPAGTMVNRNTRISILFTKDHC